MAEYHIAWLEEPLPPDDHAAYLRLKEKDSCPSPPASTSPTKQRYLDLILTQAVDYVQMDVLPGRLSTGRRICGPNRGRRIALRLP